MARFIGLSRLQFRWDPTTRGPTKSSARSVRAATSSAATACCRGSGLAISWRSAMPERTDRRWRRTTTAARCQPKSWSTTAPGGSSVGDRPLTTCSRSSRERPRREMHGCTNAPMHGLLIAFEGLDQSGKQTQAEMLRDRLKQDGRKARVVSFPDYGTSISEEIARALAGEREYEPDVMQLLYVANRYERKADLKRWLEGGLILVCDRYAASSVAYGEAFGLDPAWLIEMQRFLPRPALTILLDIAPETAAARKSADRDKYERDLAMLGRVRSSYQRQASANQWVVLAGERPKDAIATDVWAAVSPMVG